MAEPRRLTFVAYITEELLRRVASPRAAGVDGLGSARALDFRHRPSASTHKIRTVENLGLTPHVASVNLSGNELAKLDGIKAVARTLKELDVSHNQLTRLVPELPLLSQLTVLNLSHNLLASLPGAGTWKRLQALRELDIGFNCLERLSDVLNLAPCRNLCALSVLQGNGLGKLPHAREFIIASLPTISDLDGASLSDVDRTEAAERFGVSQRIAELEQHLSRVEGATDASTDQQAALESELTREREKNSKLEEDIVALRAERDKEKTENQVQTELLRARTAEFNRVTQQLLSLQQDVEFGRIDQALMTMSVMSQYTGTQSMLESVPHGEDPDLDSDVEDPHDQTPFPERAAPVQLESADFNLSGHHQTPSLSVEELDDEVGHAEEQMESAQMTEPDSYELDHLEKALAEQESLLRDHEFNLETAAKVFADEQACHLGGNLEDAVASEDNLTRILGEWKGALEELESELANADLPAEASHGARSLLAECYRTRDSFCKQQIRRVREAADAVEAFAELLENRAMLLGRSISRVKHIPQSCIAARAKDVQRLLQFLENNSRVVSGAAAWERGVHLRLVAVLEKTVETRSFVPPVVGEQRTGESNAFLAEAGVIVSTIETKSGEFREAAADHMRPVSGAFLSHTTGALRSALDALAEKQSLVEASLELLLDLQTEFAMRKSQAEAEVHRNRAITDIRRHCEAKREAEVQNLAKSFEDRTTQMTGAVQRAEQKLRDICDEATASKLAHETDLDRLRDAQDQIADLQEQVSALNEALDSLGQATLNEDNQMREMSHSLQLAQASIRAASINLSQVVGTAAEDMTLEELTENVLGKLRHHESTRTSLEKIDAETNTSGYAGVPPVVETESTAGENEADAREEVLSTKRLELEKEINALTEQLTTVRQDHSDLIKLRQKANENAERAERANRSNTDALLATQKRLKATLVEYERLLVQKRRVDDFLEHSEVSARRHSALLTEIQDLEARKESALECQKRDIDALRGDRRRLARDIDQLHQEQATLKSTLRKERGTLNKYVARQRTIIEKTGAEIRKLRRELKDASRAADHPGNDTEQLLKVLAVEERTLDASIAQLHYDGPTQNDLEHVERVRWGRLTHRAWQEARKLQKVLVQNTLPTDRLGAASGRELEELDDMTLNEDPVIKLEKLIALISTLQNQARAHSRSGMTSKLSPDAEENLDNRNAVEGPPRDLAEALAGYQQLVATLRAQLVEQSRDQCLPQAVSNTG